MKKIVLSIIVALVANQVNAQSFMIKDEFGANITSQTVDVNSTETFNQIIYHAKVQNNSVSTKNVKVRRYKLNVSIFAINDFCWTSCYDPNTDVSPFGIAIPSAATDTSFLTHYTHGESESGISTYKFVFFDVSNPADSSFFIINFNITVGINEAKANAVLSNAYPNPSSVFYSLKYDLNEYVQTAKVVMYDMLGKAVKEIPVNDRQGVLKINIEDLNAGVYFYSFIINNNKAISTKKIVVNSK